jgi:hypothetical protein
LLDNICGPRCRHEKMRRTLTLDAEVVELVRGGLGAL